MSDWATVLNGLFWFSVLTSIVGAVTLPMFVVSIPADYFVRPPSTSSISSGRVLLRLLILIARNAVAAVLSIAGAVMLLTPGPGLLMLLVALGWASFPGKLAAERKIIALPGVARTINKLRAKAGKQALQTPATQD